MEKLEIKDCEYEFLQLMGIEYVNEQFVNTKDGSRFKFAKSKKIKFGSGEVDTVYTFKGSDATIKFLRTKYSFILNSVYVTKNGYSYYLEEYGKQGLCTGVQQKDKKSTISDSASITIIVDDSERALISTRLDTVVNCNFNINTYTYYAGSDEILYLGETYDYSEEKYANILSERINELENEELKKFFLTILPTVSRVHQSIVESFENQKVKKLLQENITFK